MATNFKVEWIKTQAKRLRSLFSQEELSNEELKQFLLEEYDKRKTVVGRYFNNQTNEVKRMSIEQYINYFITGDKVLTGYNVLIKSHASTKTVAIEALEHILDQRKKYKKLQEASAKGSAEYIYYKVLQLTFKVLANSYYGILSMDSSIFYNPHIQNSITTTGQDLIATAIYLVESLIANNEKFRDEDDITTFVSNVCSETMDTITYIDGKTEDGKDNIVTENINFLDFIDEDKRKTKAEIASYLKEQSMNPVNDDFINFILDKKSVEDLNKIYYKNNLLELFKNKYFEDCIKNIANGTPTSPRFSAIIVKICNYNYIAWDKFIRISKQTRRGSIVTDTDSTFCYLGNIVHELQRRLNDTSSNCALNLCNMMIAIMTIAMRDIFETFTTNCNIAKEYRPIINIKNEFLYSRILTTSNKKNYAGWLMSELGKMIPGDDPSIHLDMKGLSIRKSTVPKPLRAKFQNLLLNDILLPEKINVLQVMKHYNAISDEVEESLKAGKTEYLIPKAVDVLSAYKDPATQEQVKSTLVWNALEPLNPIVPPDNVWIVKVKAPKLDSQVLLDLQKAHPDKYERIKKVVFEPTDADLNISKNGITAISIPMDSKAIPDYLLDMIDYDTMINANVKNANILLESLGLHCKAVNQNNYKSNVVQWT